MAQHKTDCLFTACSRAFALASTPIGRCSFKMQREADLAQAEFKRRLIKQPSFNGVPLSSAGAGAAGELALQLLSGKSTFFISARQSGRNTVRKILLLTRER
jgi:hypothetical protein